MWDLFWIRARRQRRLDEKARREGRLFNITVGTGVADFRPVSGVSSVRVECYGAGGSGGSVEPDPTHGKPGAVVIHHPKGCNKFRSPGGCWWTCPEDVFTATVEVQGAGEDGQSGRGGAQGGRGGCSGDYNRKTIGTEPGANYFVRVGQRVESSLFESKDGVIIVAAGGIEVARRMGLRS